MKHLFTLTLFYAALFFITGCSNEPGLDGLVPGRGTLTLDGAAVEGASLTFIPASDAAGARPANAITKAGGSFELMTLQPQDGIFPGEYKVIAWKSEVEITPVPNSSSIIKETDLLPIVYKTLDATPLAITIPPDGDSAITIELKK